MTSETIVTVTTVFDTLRAENRALRDELEALQQTEVGEVVAHNNELMHERDELSRQVRSLQSEVSRLGGGVR